MEGLISTFHIDIKLIIAQLINFAIVFVVLYIYAFKPLGKLMRERQREIEKGLSDAQESKEELLFAQQKAEEIVKKAKGEANTLVLNAKEKGDKLIEEAEQQAREKADELIAKAHKQIAEDTKQKEHEIYERTAHLVSLGVAKILEEDLDDEKNEQITQKALNLLKKS